LPTNYGLGMTDLVGQVAGHERRLTQQESDIQHLYRELRETHQEVRSARTDIATLDREVKETRTDIATVDGDVKQVRRDVRWLQRALSGVMAHMGVEPPGDLEE
jgi:septal ring factor EnvC (AmiA/AmiB activator)